MTRGQNDIAENALSVSRNFLYLRHGETDWNLKGRIQGHTDIPLNATGIKQAQDAANLLAGHEIHRIVSSPLIRSLKTAAIVGEYVGLPVHIDSLLKERSFGRFEGMTASEIRHQHGLSEQDIIARNLPPDAEEWSHTVARAKEAVQKWLADHPDENFLFVAHSGIFKALTETLCGVQSRTQTGKPCLFSHSKNEWRVTEV